MDTDIVAVVVMLIVMVIIEDIVVVIVAVMDTLDRALTLWSSMPTRWPEGVPVVLLNTNGIAQGHSEVAVTREIGQGPLVAAINGTERGHFAATNGIEPGLWNWRMR